MKSRLIPGRIRPISFILVVPLVILSLIVGKADIFVNSHAEALERGRHQAEVFKFN